MKFQQIQTTLQEMATRHGFLAAALVELDGGMVWHAEGAAELRDSVVSTASDYWRLYRRSQSAFQPLGAMRVAVFFHERGRVTLSECGPGMLLVVVTDPGQLDIDWEGWKKTHSALAKLVSAF